MSSKPWLREPCPRCHTRLCKHITLPIRSLSPRRRSLLRLLQLGLPNKEIAARLKTTTNYIKFYLSTYVYPDIGVNTRLEAALWANRHPKLIAGPPEDNAILKKHRTERTKQGPVATSGRGGTGLSEIPDLPPPE